MEIRIDPIKFTCANEIQRYNEIKNLSPEDKEKLNLLHSIAQNNQSVLKMNKTEYRALLSKRPLLRFRPIKNSFLKQGDQKLLAAGLGIDEKQTNEYINNIIKNNFEINNFNKNTEYSFSPLNDEKLLMTQDYVYRHGTREQALSFLRNELSDAESALRRLYRTLKKDSGGIYDYFERPCHLLDNKTAHKMHTTIKYGLDNSQNQGFITEDVNKTACEWSLRQIYNIQSNQKLREALKIVKYDGGV